MTVPNAHKKLTSNNNWTNFSVLRHGKFDGVMVTSKNSGTHWLKYMLAVALADSYEIERPKYFSVEAVIPYIRRPKDPLVFEQLPKLAFTHSIPHNLANWGWARSLASLPPYVLQTRHPMSILASHYAKWHEGSDIDWLTYLKGEPTEKVFRCDMYWLARFWNRWGDILQANADNMLSLHYEEIKRDPSAALEAVSNLWGLNLSPDVISAAVEAGTKSAMAEKVDPDAEKNVLQQRTTRLSNQFEGDALEIYQAHVKTLFRHDLGYDLLTMPAG